MRSFCHTADSANSQLYPRKWSGSARRWFTEARMVGRKTRMLTLEQRYSTPLTTADEPAVAVGKLRNGARSRGKKEAEGEKSERR